MFKWFRIAFAALLLTATAAYAALPGAYRALTPGVFGLSSLGNGLYTDAPDRRAEFDRLYTASRTQSEAFFGNMQRTPRVIICTTQDCADIFDLKPRGLTYGKHLIFLGPKGVNKMILTHELAHIQLHSKMGPQDVFNQRIPAWFNEGLATHLSKDPRLTSFTPKAAHWVKQAQSFRDWGRLHDTRDWQDTYGAAQSIVAALHVEIGDDGLRQLIDQALQSGDFDAALSAQMGTDWP